MRRPSFRRRLRCRAFARTLALAACVAGFTTPAFTAQAFTAQAFAAGPGSFELVVPVGGTERHVRVFHAVPERGAETAPVVFVMHGVSRNADGYFKVWTGLAAKHGFLLLVPEFSKAEFPGGTYNRANVVARDGTPNPETAWSFSVIAKVFEDARRRFANRCKSFGIYGHSAGGQFVHRMVLMDAKAPISVAVAANAGWYTMPDPATHWPYGLGGIDGAEAKLRRGLALKLVVLLGDADTDPNHRQLSRAAGAMAQGPNRFERGNNFFRRAREQADRLGVPFNWERGEVAGVAHSNRGMSAAAAEHLARHVSCD